jgi:uncharacterized protein YceH (UPF0502 family)
MLVISKLGKHLVHAMPLNAVIKTMYLILGYQLSGDIRRAAKYFRRTCDFKEVKTILKRIFMDLCSSKHDKIVYEGNRCPVCDLKKEVAQFEEENSTLKQRIEELENADLI